MALLAPSSVLQSMYCYWHADIHTDNGGEGEGSGEEEGGEGSSVGAAVGGVIAALIMVALIVILVITGLWWRRSGCVHIHVDCDLRGFYSLHREFNLIGNCKRGVALIIMQRSMYGIPIYTYVLCPGGGM